MQSLFAPNGARLDNIDLVILALLHENARTPCGELATAIGLSASATQQRIKRLDEGGAIHRYSAKAEESMFESWSMLLVNVELRAEIKCERAAFEVLLNQAPEVVQAFALLGAPDYLLVTVVPCISFWKQVQARIDPQNAFIARAGFWPAVGTLKRPSLHPILCHAKNKHFRKAP